MDLNDFRVLITVLSFMVFVGVVIWAFGGRQRARFDDAARLPFADGELPGEMSAARPPDPKDTGVRS